MSAATPRVSQGTSDGRRLGIAVGALTLAVALVVGATIVRQAGTLSAAPSDQGVTVSVGGYTGIPYTPTRLAPVVSVGGYTGIPYVPTRQLPKAGTGGYTGIPYTPTRVDAPAQLPGLHGGTGDSSRTYSGQ